jgi:ABC-type nitrate/sulfonate/bicarbonate transport system ATPase subunit
MNTHKTVLFITHSISEAVLLSKQVRNRRCALLVLAPRARMPISGPAAMAGHRYDVEDRRLLDRHGIRRRLARLTRLREPRAATPPRRREA